MNNPTVSIVCQQVFIILLLLYAYFFTDLYGLIHLIPFDLLILCLVQNVHTAFMRTVPSYARQTEVWADLLDKLGFKQIIFIHSSDQEGRAMLGKFQSRTESESKKVIQPLVNARFHLSLLVIFFLVITLW